MNSPDPYLQPGRSFQRLLDEYRRYGSLVVAFDFDNTVYDFHRQGHIHEQVIKLLRQLHAAGCYLICFTASENPTFVRTFLTEHQIPFHSINENPPFFTGPPASKIYYNALLDDRAGLRQVFDELTLLLAHVTPSLQSISFPTQSLS